MQKIKTNSRYFCFKEVGHMPYMEEPQLFNDIVMPFLENHVS